MCTYLQVYNVSALTEQMIEMYFEHERSGGGPIQEIEMNKQEDYAIISFEKYGGMCFLIYARCCRVRMCYTCKICNCNSLYETVAPYVIFSC